VSAAYPPERRGAAIGILEGVTGLATIGGPVIGGAVSQGLSWEWIFWVNVPIGLVALPLALTRIGESFGSDRALDIPGLALVGGGAFGVVWALVRGNTAGWGSAEVVAALTAGVALLALFVAWELRTREPMLPMRFFRSRAFTAGNAATFFLFAALFGAVFFFAQFLQTSLGNDPLEAGLRLMPWTATLFVIAPIAGALADRIGERPLVVGGLALQAVGLAWLAVIAEPGLPFTEMLAPSIVTGVGASAAIPTSANAVVGAVAMDAVGKAAGANGMLRELGGVFGIAVAVAMFAGAGSYASAQAFSDGFAPAIGVAAGLSLAGALAGLALPRRPAPAAYPVTPASSKARCLSR
jgi:EmrB/QacA subfamily drug resistance transporter